MSAEVLVLGIGRIGYALSRFLLGEGYGVTVADNSPERLERAAKLLGVETVRVDVTSSNWTEALRGGFDLICSCLPGSIGFSTLKTLLRMGMKVVDVSYFPEDPQQLGRAAEEGGGLAVIDAGVAPGLSNLMAGRAYEELGGLDGLEVYVGGLPLDPQGKPLGITITWNPMDLIEEYTRPARIVEEGRIKAVDPLSKTGTVDVPTVGRFEYFVSDGLRTMLYTLRGVKHMVEYTLRYPGHVEAMRLLRNLGLLSREEVKVRGVRVSPAEVLASLLERRLSRDPRDTVVLYVKCWRGNDRREYLTVDRYDEEEGLTAMSRTTGYTMGAIASTVLEGIVGEEKGIIPPEVLGMRREIFEGVISKLKGRGVRVEELR